MSQDKKSEEYKGLMQDLKKESEAHYAYKNYCLYKIAEAHAALEMVTNPAEVYALQGRIRALRDVIKLPEAINSLISIRKEAEGQQGVDYGI